MVRINIALAFLTVAPVFAQLQSPRTIILIGPPGSGKSVQAEYLHKQYKIPVISLSQVLQQEFHRKSTLGKALAASMASGEFIADGPANNLIKARLLRPEAGRGFVLDGYPATEGQAKALDDWLTEHGFPKPTIVRIDVTEDVSRNRLVRRQRADDERDNIERRLRDYKDIGRLVEQWYGADRLVRIDGTGSPLHVSSRIAAGIDAMQSRDLQIRSSEGLKRRPPEK